MTERRKKRKTYNESGHAHFLTYSCQQRLPLLNRDRTRQWVIDAIESARVKLRFSVWAYVIMPEHVHALISPNKETYEMRRILAALKAPVSRRAKSYLEQNHQSKWLSRLSVVRNGENRFRFWQAGGGFDSNLWNERPVEDVIDYIHANPVRRGLVERPSDWFWSSAGDHSGLQTGPLRLDPVQF